MWPEPEPISAVMRKSPSMMEGNEDVTSITALDTVYVLGGMGQVQGMPDFEKYFGQALSQAAQMLP
jgi:hypothetical protein